MNSRIYKSLSSYVAVTVTLLAIFWVSMPSAYASMVTLNFSGSLSAPFPSGNPLTSIMSGGNKFSGSLALDFTEKVAMPPSNISYPKTTNLAMSIDLNTNLPGVNVNDSPYNFSTPFVRSRATFKQVSPRDLVLYEVSSRDITVADVVNGLRINSMVLILTLLPPQTTSDQDVRASFTQNFIRGDLLLDFGSPTGPRVFGRINSVAVVPIPAAAWLFVSGLLGLIGFANRKQLIINPAHPALTDVLRLLNNRRLKVHANKARAKTPRCFEGVSNKAGSMH